MANQAEQNNQELLRQKVAEQFPDEDSAKILALLYRYESPAAAGRLRVQLAILKLSKGNVDRLREYVEVARTDYRDVLFWAETPEQTKVVSPRIANHQQQEARAKFRRYLMLLLLAALLVIILSARLTTTTGERLAMSGIFVLAGLNIIWRIQRGRL
ncbi:MAG: hypothetical protein CL608_10205 [Anaerolineaceae bacterium]|nr:hypothetical protein [Anaerolineaceae bacterium]